MDDTRRIQDSVAELVDNQNHWTTLQHLARTTAELQMKVSDFAYPIFTNTEDQDNPHYDEIDVNLDNIIEEAGDRAGIRLADFTTWNNVQLSSLRPTHEAVVRLLKERLAEVQVTVFKLAAVLEDADLWTYDVIAAAQDAAKAAAERKAEAERKARHESA